MGAATLLEHSELVNLDELLKDRKTWQRRLMDMNADRVDWRRLSWRFYFIECDSAVIFDNAEHRRGRSVPSSDA